MNRQIVSTTGLWQPFWAPEQRLKMGQDKQKG